MFASVLFHHKQLGQIKFMVMAHWSGVACCAWADVIWKCTMSALNWFCSSLLLIFSVHFMTLKCSCALSDCSIHDRCSVADASSTSLAHKQHSREHHGLTIWQEPPTGHHHHPNLGQGKLEAARRAADGGQRSWLNVLSSSIHLIRLHTTSGLDFGATDPL
ncbi:hypothetical protein BCR44DRAFT_211547 [Catenaria anguillulae PL171]|uniref:Uncharacterized protein n=1 Tax=Catenaria anguillulae PL171 TaxID=765915 RepID=A0A1Y2HZR8_9FUNG|nr:hypothetical protein BCR44DRAFT_211547 [Catenaria anguillulae PL171]